MTPRYRLLVRFLVGTALRWGEATALTFAGVIVVAPGVFSHAEDAVTISGRTAALDALHLRKIDLADRVLVVDPGGYIGESTSRDVRPGQWQAGVLYGSDLTGGRHVARGRRGFPAHRKCEVRRSIPEISRRRRMGSAGMVGLPDKKHRLTSRP